MYATKNSNDFAAVGIIHKSVQKYFNVGRDVKKIWGQTLASVIKMSDIGPDVAEKQKDTLQHKSVR